MKKSKIKNILWDNDGVLVDTEKFFFKATKKICLAHGVEFSIDLFRELVLKQAVGPWEFFREKGYGEEDIQKLKEERDGFYNSYLINEDISMDGAGKVIRELSNNFDMVIVTSSKRSHFETIHNRSGFLKYFDFSLTIEDYENCKPSPEPYLKALDMMGAEKEESVIIEDSYRGLTAAVAAGIRCIVIPTEMSLNQDFSKAYMVIDSIKKLPGILIDL